MAFSDYEIHQEYTSQVDSIDDLEYLGHNPMVEDRVVDFLRRRQAKKLDHVVTSLLVNKTKPGAHGRRRLVHVGSKVCSSDRIDTVDSCKAEAEELSKALDL